MLRREGLKAVTIEDEKSLRHVGIYDALRRRLLDDGVTFAVADAPLATEDNTRLLNLAFYRPGDVGEVLPDPVLTADQLAHNAWHHVVDRGLGPSARSAAGLLLAESVASAFDVYLIGRLLGQVDDAAFLETQVPAMADAAAAAGLDAAGFETLLERMAAGPEKAFGELRALLYGVSLALVAAADVDAAAAVLAEHQAHPFAALLHHYEIPTWVLFVRAHADASAPEEPAREAHAALVAADDPIAWLEERWL